MEKKNTILHSETIKAVISDPPGRLVRRGSFILLSVFIIIMVFACIVPYPDVIISPVEITTANPPVTLLAKRTGKINGLYVKDGDKIIEGQILAVIETAASMDEILALKATLERLNDQESLDSEKFPLYSGLGELQDPYAKFLSSNSDYVSFIRNDLYASRIKSINEEIRRIREYIDRTGEKEDLLMENLRIEKGKYERDSILSSKNVNAPQDLENSRQSYNRLKLELLQVRIDYSARTIDLSEKEKNLQEYKIMREEEKDKLISSRNENFINLKAYLKVWMNQYLLISPVSGTISFTKYWSENQSVILNEPVLYVIPDHPGDFIGRISLKMYRSGKVREGMKVNIKLSGFPYLEYGMVSGIVKSKSLVPSENTYIIEISLPHGLLTSYGKQLDFNHNMQGSAEIITNRLTLIQKLIDPFRYVASKIRQ